MPLERDSEKRSLCSFCIGCKTNLLQKSISFNNTSCHKQAGAPHHYLLELSRYIMYGKYERGILYVILYFIYWSQKIFFRNQFLSIIQSKLGLPTITCLSGVGEQLLIFIKQVEQHNTPNPNQSLKSILVLYLYTCSWIWFICNIFHTYMFIFMIQNTCEQ